MRINLILVLFLVLAFVRGDTTKIDIEVDIYIEASINIDIKVDIDIEAKKLLQENQNSHMNPLTF